MSSQGSSSQRAHVARRSRGDSVESVLADMAANIRRVDARIDRIRSLPSPLEWRIVNNLNGTVVVELVNVRTGGVLTSWGPA